MECRHVRDVQQPPMGTRRSSGASLPIFGQPLRLGLTLMNEGVATNWRLRPVTPPAAFPGPSPFLLPMWRGGAGVGWAQLLLAPQAWHVKNHHKTTRGDAGQGQFGEPPASDGCEAHALPSGPLPLP